MAAKNQKLAVITGDIVGSTKLGPRKLSLAIDALSDSASAQEKWHGASLKFTRNRGDGWQVILARPELALRSALTFRAKLRALGDDVDSYMGIALGMAPLPKGANLNAETGEIFTHSGRLLDVMKQVDAGIRIEIWPTGPLSAAAILADQISQGWTQTQAAAMGYMLDPTVSIYYTDLAHHLGKSRQAVTKSLRAAKEKPIEVALSAIEQLGVTDD